MPLSIHLYSQCQFQCFRTSKPGLFHRLRKTTKESRFWPGRTSILWTIALTVEPLVFYIPLIDYQKKSLLFNNKPQFLILPVIFTISCFLTSVFYFPKITKQKFPFDWINTFAITVVALVYFVSSFLLKANFVILCIIFLFFLHLLSSYLMGGNIFYYINSTHCIKVNKKEKHLMGRMDKNSHLKSASITLFKKIHNNVLYLTYIYIYRLDWSLRYTFIHQSFYSIQCYQLC